MLESLEEKIERLQKDKDDRLHDDLKRLSGAIETLSVRVTHLTPLTEWEKLSDRVGALEKGKFFLIGGGATLMSLQAFNTIISFFHK